MNRKEFITTAGMGAVATAALGFGKCSGPSVAVEVATAVTFLGKVATLLPGKAQVIGKITTALSDFNSFYQRGDFANAGKLFSVVDADFTQLIADVGVNLSPSVKIALALVDAAVSAIAVLMKGAVPAAVASKAKLTDEQRDQVAAIERRAAKTDKLFAAIQ